MKILVESPKRVNKEDVEDIWFAWFPVFSQDNYGFGLVTKMLWLEKVRRIRNDYFNTTYYKEIY
jgi:hypothetical protein